MFNCMFVCITVKETTIYPNVYVNFVLYDHNVVYLLVIAFHKLLNLYIYIYIYIYVQCNSPSPASSPIP